jgi:hypothetical protein
MLALRKLPWADWIPSVHVFLGGPSDPDVDGAWQPHLAAAALHWVSEQHFAADGDWAQSDDLLRCAPRDADVILTLDADTIPVAPLTDVLDYILRTESVGGVIAHYPFPFFPGCSVRDRWHRVADGITDAPLDFAFSYTLIPPETPAGLRLTPFYVNGGVVFFPRVHFDDLLMQYLAIRPRLISRMPNADFTGQAAIALAIAECGVPTTALSMRYNFPNDTIADQLYPGELAEVRIVHYLRTDSFDRQRIFVSAAEYDRFLSLPLSGSNRFFQGYVRAIVGVEYPFDES